MEATLESLRQVSRRCDIAANLGCVSHHFSGEFGWAAIGADPAPFLSFGWCSESWLRNALPALIEAQHAAPLGGESLLHLDVRSDNLAIRDGLAILFDWNWACRGNADLGRAYWSPASSSKVDHRRKNPSQLAPSSPRLRRDICAPRHRAPKSLKLRMFERSKSARRRSPFPGR